MRKLVFSTGLSLVSTLAMAATTPPTTETNTPQTGLFIGLGGSYNSVGVEQDLSGTGITNVYSGSTLVAYGEAVGPMPTYTDTQSTFAPEAQFGYFRHFKNSEWLWGAKFFYQYLNTTSSDNDIDAPQFGNYTTTGAAPTNTTFTGNAFAESSELMTNDEMALMPFIGKSFKNSYIYLGVGPSLFNTEMKINNLRCFADINGTHTNIGGTPINVSENQRVWGGAAQIGITYYLNSSWFVDLNYTYARSADYDVDENIPFTSTSSSDYTNVGTVELDSTQHVAAQTLAFTINKVFA